ncbi:lysophospholipid acyltransferase family protein [Croceivirga thetidis]|uniref:Glycerol acyltransferase n=1 Tax=Croceivirga thetidis TaxID=2721623 RepID=A0ABX1GLU5_9FLAO|nr:lysophospholipid acyltransferase family protein [Croceivirga thetidis]NKI30871.1 glycerol acyltransferase [Croceivirga thetidis]
MNSNKTKLTYSSEGDKKIKRIIIRSIEKLSGQPKLEQMYNEVLALNPSSEEIWKILIDRLDLKLDFEQLAFDAIPQKEPLIFIANHPFGVVDGIVFGHMVKQKRKDFKFLVNSVLCREKVLNRYFLPIDFATTKEAIQTNIKTRKDALRCIENGESIVIFPSGGVATSKRPFKKAEELDWKKFILKLIRQSKASVVPFYFYGQNSPLFQFISQVSMDLRISMLLNEVRNKVGKTIKLAIGKPITFSEMQAYKGDELLDFLYNQVHQLAK